MLSKEAKSKLIANYGKSKNDTGSCEIQIAIFSERIHQISEHLKNFSKDLHSQRGLVKLVGQRKALLNYLKKNDPKSFDNLTSSLKSNGYL